MTRCCGKEIDNQEELEAISLDVLDGSETNPSIAFINDPDTGLYRVGTDEIGITAGGVKQVDISTTSSDFVGRIRAPNGTTALPGLAFTAAPDVGLIGAASSLSIAVNNIFIGQFAGGANPGYYAQTKIYVPDGTAALPQYTFNADTNTGLFRVGSDNIGISAGGFNKLDIGTSQNNTYNRLYQNLNNYSSVSGYYALENEKQKMVSNATATVIVSTWNSRTAASTNDWRGVCWAAELGLFVAVAITGSSRVMTSPDGVVWTGRTEAAANSWRSVCWSPELALLVAISDSGVGNRVMTSTNAINWTSRTSAVDNNWISVCWAPELSLFVACAYSGTGNRIMTSPNGTNWTARTTPVDNNWFSVCWSPELSLFVSVAVSGTTDRVMTSPNGVTWTIGTTPNTNNYGTVCWASELGLFCAVSDTGILNRIMTSPNGLTWTARTTPVDNSWQGLCWAPDIGMFVATSYTGTGNRVMTSPNGTNWTARTTPVDNSWTVICWSPELSLFASVATSGSSRVMTSSLSGRLPTAYNVYRAPDGTISTPSYSFTTDPNTGIYNIGPDNIGISCNGALQVDVSAARTQLTNPLYVPTTSNVAAPAIAFTGQTNSGLGLLGTGGVGLVSVGRPRILLNTVAKTLTDGTLTNIATLTYSLGGASAGFMEYTVSVSGSGGTFQIECGMLNIVSNYDSVLVQSSVTKVSSQQSLNSGTLSCTFAVSNAANVATLQVNGDTSFVGATLFFQAHWRPLDAIANTCSLAFV